MRLSTITIAFVFFATVFASPIYPLRGNAIELSKRGDEGETMPDISAGGGGGDPPQRGRPLRKASTSTRAGVAKGKAKAVPAEGENSDAEASKSPTGATKRTKTQGSRSVSNKRAKCNNPDLLNRADFLEALKHIQKDKPAGQGSQGLAVYHMTEEIKGCRAVVKIIDRDRLDTAAVNKIPNEVAGLSQVKQLFGWGRRTSPNFDYVLMKNMGVPLSQTGLDATKDAAFIQKKKTEALQRYETEFHLKHGDPAGNGNYLWYINEDIPATDPEARFTVEVIDWADHVQIGPEGTQYAPVPTKFVVPNDASIYAPEGSPESSKVGSHTPPTNSEGDKTPPRTGVSGTRTGTRSQTRNQAGTSGAA